MEFKIHSAYSGRFEGYQIFLDGEQVHFTKDDQGIDNQHARDCMKWFKE